MSNFIKVFETLLIGFLFPLTLIYYGLNKYILYGQFFSILFLFIYFFIKIKIPYFVFFKLNLNST